MEVTGRQFCLNIRNNIVTTRADQSENGLPCAVVSSPALVTGISQEAKKSSLGDDRLQHLHGGKVCMSPSDLLNFNMLENTVWRVQ